MRFFILTLLACSLLLSPFSAWAQTAPPPAPPPPDPRFGSVEAYQLHDKATDLRVGWDRMIVRWSTRQPDNADQWNIPGYETPALEAAQAVGREMVGLLMGTPRWASDAGVEGGVPRGLYLSVDDPANLWAVYVRRIVTEHAGRINRWIVWNEPDIAPYEYGAQFEGTVEDYYQLLKVAYLVAKRANPQAQIHLGGVTHWHDVIYNRTPFLQRLFDVARRDPTARANRFYFDVATLHIYFRTQTVYDITNFYRQLLNRYGLRQPIWLNETNAPPADDPALPWLNPMFALTQEQQAAFLVQSPALALAAGAERVAVYKVSPPEGVTPNADYYGLYRPDGSARPAATAWGMVTTHFAGVRRTTLTTLRTYYLVQLDRGNAITRVAWARTANPVTLTLRPLFARGTVMVYDALGNAVPTTPQRGGAFTVTLPGAVCPNNDCVVQGLPVLIVETR